MNSNVCITYHVAYKKPDMYVVVKNTMCNNTLKQRIELLSYAQTNVVSCCQALKTRNTIYTRKYVESVWIHYHRSFPLQAILPFSTWSTDVHPSIWSNHVQFVEPSNSFRTSCRSFGSVRSISLVSRLKVPTICRANDQGSAMVSTRCIPVFQ